MSSPVHSRRDLPLLDAPPVERADAARNRQALLVAARELIDSCGVDAVTMENVAARAGVGKGTVFRRFESREGLMGAILNFSETEWQAAVISGPPPLGPGAPPLDRLLAFGRSRLDTTLLHADLIRAAGTAGSRAAAAYSFSVMHVRYLLAELGVTGDLPLLATALLSPMEVLVLDHQVNLDGLSVDRIHDGWVDLARRIVAGG
ncbi:TetR/AcrR family transcriptional regulator [Nocardioides sp. SYSU D00038]|uniref:TetR/AcrR family transcriptional regulator n=1 Tax=Nocardioides sp. SYSU D00038 TaxID=2812554 RepID=UPI001966F02D|nr:TetR/AcrR family transcriptional regulator [Nocardioides sp. SYSU D00038]